MDSMQSPLHSPKKLAPNRRIQIVRTDHCIVRAIVTLRKHAKVIQGTDAAIDFGVAASPVTGLRGRAVTRRDLAAVCSAVLCPASAR